jgi:small subunit ribosomal protein S7
MPKDEKKAAKGAKAEPAPAKEPKKAPAKKKADAKAKAEKPKAAKATEKKPPKKKAAPKAKAEKPKAEKAAEKKPPKTKAAAKAKAEKPKAEKVAEKKPPKKKAAAKAKAEKPKAEKAAEKKPAKKPAKKVEEKKAEKPPKKKPAKKAEAEKPPKKKPAKKAKVEEPEDHVVEAVDEKTDRRVTYTIKPLFGKYSFSGVVVTNPGLQRYINIDPVSVPHTGAKHANRPFAKQNVNIVERLINNMMRTGHGTGQKAKMYRVVEEAFDIIAKRTKSNPIQVLVDGLSNSAPKEEVTRLRYGGINVPKAVDVSASRRLDFALRNICKGAVASSHKNRKPLQQCLADEVILAAKRDINSFAVTKKEEIERIAASAR